MKLTNFLKKKVVILGILIGGAFLLQSCGGGNNTPTTPTPVFNTTTLKSALNDANNLVSSSVEGTAEGQFVYGSIAILQTAIDLAQAVFDNTAAYTQGALDNTAISLSAAIVVFNSQAIVPIDPTNLVGQWTFDGGTGTTVADFSGNNRTGTFGSVAGFGGGLPSWTTDRYGNANKAIMFDKGAKITIPYNAALNPENITISVWVNIAEVRNNRFIGLHSWLGFKWEVQDGMKSFFTANVTGGNPTDRDFAGANPLVLDTWYNLAVSFGNGHTVFYVNGFPVQDWNDTPGTLAVVSGHDLVFGVGSSQYADVTTNYDADKIIPVAWGGYLHGALDEVRIYKTVLSASQVQSIYDTEKVPN